MRKENFNQQPSEAYSKMPSFFKRLTENMLKENVPEDVFAAWKSLTSAMESADSIIDNIQDGKKRERSEEELLGFLRSDQDVLMENPQLIEQMYPLRECVNKLSDRQKNMFITSLSHLFKVTEAIRTATNAKDIAFLTRLEGQLTSRLFLSFIPDQMGQNENTRRLHKTAIKLGRVGNAMDTFFDWNEDYKNNQISVPATLSNKAKLAYNSASDIPYLAINIGPIKAIKFSIKALRLLKSKTG